MFRVLCISLLLSCRFLAASDNYPRNAGTDVLHYEFRLALNDSTDIINGSAKIEIRIHNADSVVLDLKNINPDGTGMRVSHVREANEEIRWKHSYDRLVIYLPVKNAIDTIDLTVDYSGIPSDGLIISNNRYGHRVFFADHWPNRAHNYLPCVDHPNDKASVDFVITAPGKYSIVANGLKTGEVPGSKNMKTTTWSEQAPLPMKVMAFGAAEFAVSTAGVVNGIEVTSWVYPENRGSGTKAYSAAVRPLEYFMKAIGEYPFGKLANVQSKTIYGGMENAGCIFYSENSVLRENVESLLAHEIAHQWFGDCVTEDDWHHIWLSEGFATYLTSMYFESFLGKERLMQDMDRSRQMVISYYDRNKKPVIDTTVTNLKLLLNTNSYEKGAWVLHMLRHEVGDEAFISGLRNFYSGYKYSNALTADFLRVMEESSGRDLGWFFRQWLYLPGHPELSIAQGKVNKSNVVITIEQKQENLFRFSIDLKIRGSEGEKIVKVPVNERITRISYPSDSQVKIIPDPETGLLYEIKN